MPITEKQLNTIFKELKKIMEKYSPPFSVKKPSLALKNKKSYELVSLKNIAIEGRQKKKYTLPASLYKKTMLGFTICQFMPI